MLASTFSFIQNAGRKEFRGSNSRSIEIHRTHLPGSKTRRCRTPLESTSYPTTVLECPACYHDQHEIIVCAQSRNGIPVVTLQVIQAQLTCKMRGYRSDRLTLSLAGFISMSNALFDPCSAESLRSTPSSCKVDQSRRRRDNSASLKEETRDVCRRRIARTLTKYMDTQSITKAEGGGLVDPALGFGKSSVRESAHNRLVSLDYSDSLSRLPIRVAWELTQFTPVYHQLQSLPSNSH